jgi:hypothetical protein
MGNNSAKKIDGSIKRVDNTAHDRVQPVQHGNLGKPAAHHANAIRHHALSRRPRPVAQDQFRQDRDMPTGKHMQRVAQ